MSDTLEDLPQPAYEGTVAVAAIQNDRDYVGFEADAENHREVIERRIGEAKRQLEASVNEEAEADD